MLGVLPVLAFLGLACRVPPSVTWAACAHIQAAAVDECSGIVKSRRHADVYWVHNDSGDRARFFGIDHKGDLLIEVDVRGATNVDWEEMATDDAGRLYIGDFGNNRNRRRDLVVYVVDEPDPRAGVAPRIEVPVVRRLPFRYPDQKAYPDAAMLDFDCEAMFWDAGQLYLLTKHRSDLRTTLYRLDPTRTEEQVVERLENTDIGSLVTAADMSQDGKVLAVLSYHYIHLFERSGPGAPYLSGKSHRTLIEGRQCEGLCIDDGRIRYTNEQREIYCVPIRTLWTLERYMPETPVLEAPQVTPELDGRPSEWRAGEGTLRCALTAFVGAEGAGTGTVPQALVDSSALRVGWCPDGLRVAMRLPPRPAPSADCTPPEDTGRPLALFMVGAGEPARPCLDAEDAVWALVEPAPDSLALLPWDPEDTQPRCAAPAPASVRAPRIAVWRRPPDPSRHVELLLPVPGPPLTAGATVAFDVLLRIPGCAGDAELGWAATSDMQPIGNPLLWGRVRLSSAPSGRSSR